MRFEGKPKEYQDMVDYYFLIIFKFGYSLLTKID